MNKYKKTAIDLIENNYHVMPVVDKRPIVKNFQNIRGYKILDTNYNFAWDSCNGIGILCGSDSNIICLDIDIIDEENPELIEFKKELLSMLPPIYCGMQGNPKKPYARFFQYNGERNRNYNFIHVEVISGNKKQKVIPPSLNPDSKTEYKWIGRSLHEVDNDELPLLDPKILDFLDNKNKEYKKLYKNKNIKIKNQGRNNKLVSECFNYFKKGLHVGDVAHLIYKLDKEIHVDKPLFSDKLEFPNDYKNPIYAAYKFASSVFNTYVDEIFKNNKIPPQFIPLDEDKNTDYLEYKMFFNKTLKGSKKDFIDNVLKIKSNDGLWRPVGNKIESLKSIATDYGLKPGFLKSHFSRYEDELKADYLFKLEDWDKHDHIAEILSYVGCSNLPNHLLCELFKEWLSKLVRRLKYQEQNTMIILHGDQNVGKDNFIYNLLNGFKPYFTNFTDTIQEKDIYMQMAQNIVLNVSEYDRLSRKHPGFIKDLITRDVSNFRPSHMQYLESFLMRSSFIGSTNTTDFLTDHTGNRRFWIVLDTKIDWTYPKDRASQVVAQAFHLADINYVASNEAKALVKQTANDLSPDDIEQSVIEAYNHHLSTTYPLAKSGEKYNQSQIYNVLYAVQKETGLKSIRSVKSILKRHGAQHRDEKSRSWQLIS